MGTMETETEPPFGPLGKGQNVQDNCKGDHQGAFNQDAGLLVFCTYRSLLKISNAAWIKPYNAHVPFLRWHYQIRLWVSDIALSALQPLCSHHVFIFHSV